MHRKSWLLGILIVACVISATAQTGGKKRRPLPYEYGRVVIQTYSQKASLAPVVFEHWIHRSMFTCRVCHVDVGFAMKPGASGIKADDNRKGYFCGACHNGRMIHDGRTIFPACSKLVNEGDAARCERCHSQGKQVPSDRDFAQFVKTMPRERFGNGIDWQAAEETGLIHPSDFVPGLSIKRKNLRIENDFSLNSKVAGMPDIIFSHRKHTVWNGCELCHPEIFVGVKKGTTRYSMVTIFEGNSCGACHNTVAFPLMDCQRCHTKPVQP
jgi:c(7)-type cytochrome triheme protein